jgi:hypothetical protein
VASYAPGNEGEKGVLRIISVKAELYLQKLYHIPVEADSRVAFHAQLKNVFSLFKTNAPLVSKGTGLNYGVDLSLEYPLRWVIFLWQQVLSLAHSTPNYNWQRKIQHPL